MTIANQQVTRLMSEPTHQIDTHAVATLGLILSDFLCSRFAALANGAHVPHVDSAIVCCTCKKLAVFAQRNRPYLPCFGVIYQMSVTVMYPGGKPYP